MYNIKIDTSSKEDKSAFLYKDENLIETIPINDGIDEGISNLLKKHNLEPKDVYPIEHIKNFEGTSFTGLRIGHTFINVFNYLFGKSDFKETAPKYHQDPNINTK